MGQVTIQASTFSRPLQNLARTLTIWRNSVKAGHIYVFPFVSLSNFLSHQEGMFSRVHLCKHGLSVRLRKTGVFLYSIHCHNHRDWGRVWSVTDAQWIFLKLLSLLRTKAFGHSGTVISESVTLRTSWSNEGKENNPKCSFSQVGQ